MPNSSRPFQIQVFNQISQTGLKRLSPDRYRLGKDVAQPDAILVRSADLHSMNLPDSVKAIGRAGAGTNNIPVKNLSKRGVPVFNTPGANANAVKELVLAGMLMAARNLPGAIRFVSALQADDPNLEKSVEEAKKEFSGYELQGHTLGIIGLGKIGCLVAESAIRLGMHVTGYDPEITVDAAWRLPSQVRKAHSITEVLSGSHFVSLHVPLLDATRELINQKSIDQFRHGAVLLNFSRDRVVSEEAVLSGLDSQRLRYYVSDFPTARVVGHPKIIALPHLGASTREAEENCAVMVVDQVSDYLENGNIVNAVNFPTVVMPRESRYRLAIAHANVPNMVGQTTTTVAKANVNIHTMLNKSLGEMAYTLVDSDTPVPDQVVESMSRIEGVLSVRYLPLPA